MYNRRIKNSILFFIAAMLTCAFCLSSVAQAASVTVQTRPSQTNVRGALIEYELPDYEVENGTTEVYDSLREKYTYQFTIYPEIMFTATDSYVSGVYTFDVSFQVPSFSGWALSSCVQDFNVYNFQGLYATSSQYSTNYMPGYFTVRVLVDDFSQYQNVYFALGSLTITCTFAKTSQTATSLPTPEVGFSTNEVSNKLNQYPTPQGLGFRGVIEQAILDALDDPYYGEDPNKFGIRDLLSIYLHFLMSTSDSVDSINDNVSILVSNLTTVISNQSDSISKLRSLLTAINDFQSNYLTMTSDWILPALNGINDKLTELINIGATQTEGASEAQAAADQLSNQVNYLANQPTLSDNDIFSGIDAGAAAYGAPAADIYFWAWDAKIAGILGVVMSLALIGFIIYGKSG